MRIEAGIVLSILLGLVGCSKESQESTSNAAEIDSTPAVVASAPKALLPTFAAAEDCLSTCTSEWWRVAQGGSEGGASMVTPEMPLAFAALLESPQENERFVQLMEQFPQHLHPLGILQPGDEEKLVNDGPFGSYKKEKPEIFGHLDNVINNNGKRIYIYAGVHYLRFQNNASGMMHVAIDPATHEFAGLIRANKDLDEYYIAGAESLRSTLLAFTVTDDVEFASMSAHYLKKKQGSYVGKPIIFPLHKDRDEASVRINLLNDMLGSSAQIAGVPAPAFLLKVQAEQAEKAWYGVSQGRDRCIETPMSPADRIEVIREAGIAPRIQETNADGRLSVVEISAVEGGYETTWRFFKNKANCEQTLVSSMLIPDRYR